jgi:hypothetical protein
LLEKANAILAASYGSATEEQDEGSENGPATETAAVQRERPSADHDTAWRRSPEDDVGWCAPQQWPAEAL